MIRFASIFSGAGVCDHGYRKVFRSEPLFAIDQCEQAQALYRHNFPNTRYFLHSIGGDGDEWEPLELEQYRDLDVLHMSPPCEEYSIANRGDNKKDSKDREASASVVKSTLPIIELLNPTAIIVENVYAFADELPYQVYKNYVRNAGYKVYEIKTDLAKLGLPQQRCRFISIATKGNAMRLELPRRKQVGWFGALRGVIQSMPPTELADWQITRLKRTMCLTPVGADRYMMPRLGANTSNCVPRRSHEPSFTVRSFRIKPNAHLFDYIHTEAGDIRESRRFTPRAIARLMGLDDRYKLNLLSEARESMLLGEGFPASSAEVIGQLVQKSIEGI